MEHPSEPIPPEHADTRARPTPPPVVLSGTAQLLAAVPHLLGYHPGRSVVVMASTLGDDPGTGRPGTGHPDAAHPGAAGARSGRGRATIVVTARFDLPRAEEAGPVVGTLATPLAQAARQRGGPLLLHAFVYEADDAGGSAVAAAVAGLADEHGHRMQDLVLVRGGHYLPLAADGEVLDQATGPVHGWLPVPQPADVPGVADLVLRGRFAAASRDDVVARVRRRDESAAAATGLALSFLAVAPETYDPLEALGRLSCWVVRGEGDPAPRDRARIAVALADRTLRDALMARWLPRLFTLEEVLPEEMARDVRRVVPPWPTDDVGGLDRLLGVAARVPEPDAVPLLTLAGAVAWGLGEGTVANEAIDLALELDPAYTMAGLLQRALIHGMPPWVRRADVA